jgi:hypothetical protein
MLIVETIAKIQPALFGRGRLIKVICRDLGKSRKAVRRVIRSGVTEFRASSQGNADRQCFHGSLS